jgi:L-seryl-tRNA(Ser) seleniumtransferase
LSVEVAPSNSMVGGGSFPTIDLESRSVIVAASRRSAAEMAAGLRICPERIVGRIENDRFVIDLRTVDPEQESKLAARIVEFA